MQNLSKITVLNQQSLLSQNSISLFSKVSIFLIGVILLALSSKVSAPFYGVPLTLQTCVVYFLAASFGIIGFYSTLTYLLLGLAGLPIFAYGGGFQYVLNPTFGYLIGMVISSFVITYFSKNLFNKSLILLVSIIFLGAFITFILGLSYLSFFVGGFGKALNLGLYPFIYSELLKISLAVAISYTLIKNS